MRVRMLTLAAGADGVLRPGDEVEVSQEKGMAWIEGGYAEAVCRMEGQGPARTEEEIPPVVPPEGGREVAAVEAPEREVAPAGKVKGRRRRSSINQAGGA